MKLLMYGVSKETVTKEEANKYKLANGRKERQMTEILEFDGIEEIVILDSDFRNEYYLYVDELVFSHGEFLRYLSEETGKDLEEIILETYSKFNEDVLRHLYEIASGYLSTPQGCFEILLAIEKALNLAKHLDTVGKILDTLFDEAIELAYSLKLNNLLQPLNSSQASKYVYLLEKNLGSLKNKNYLLSVNDCDLIVLSKVLLMAGAQTIAITQPTSRALEKQFEVLKNKLTDNEKNRLRIADSKSLNYRLSRADGIILNLDKINILDKKTREEVLDIRQTKKMQYLIDTSDEPIEEIECEDLDFELINTNIKTNYNDDEQQEAMIEYDDILSSNIKRFMKFFEQFQNQNLNELSY